MQDASKMESISSKILGCEQVMLVAKQIHVNFQIKELRVKADISGTLVVQMTDAKGKVPSEAALDRAVKSSKEYIDNKQAIADSEVDYNGKSAMYNQAVRMYDIHMAAN